MKTIRIGYMGLSKASWKTPKIMALMQDTIASLSTLPVKIIHAKDLTMTEADALAIADDFKKNDVDAIIMHMASFPVGAIIPAIAKRFDVPVILFANPEKPEEGGIWSQNSFCGANMAAHVLHKMGRQYHPAWGTVKEAAAVIAPLLKTIICKKNICETKIGLVGGRAPGFYTSNFDEMKLRSTFGTSVEILDLLEIVDKAKNLTKKESEEGLKNIMKAANSVCAVSDKELQLAGDLFQAFVLTAEKYKLDSYAIRCWPEFSDIYGIAPCAVIGLLNDAKLATSCEGDVLGAMTMKIQQNLSGGAIPFFIDLISFDYNDNTGVVWHCGAAPSSLCKRFEETVLRKHARVDGGDKKGVTNDFSLKAGRITLAKLDETETGYRMLIAAGTALDTDKFIRGNPLRIKFDGCVKKLIDTIIKEGFEHHYSVIYADIMDELLGFCEQMNIKPIIIK